MPKTQKSTYNLFTHNWLLIQLFNWLKTPTIKYLFCRKSNQKSDSLRAYCKNENNTFLMEYSIIKNKQHKTLHSVNLNAVVT